MSLYYYSVFELAIESCFMNLKGFVIILVEVFGERNWQQMTTSDNFSNILSHLTTFHDHVTTFMMTGEDLWTTLSTLSDNLMMTLMTIVKTY